MMWRPNVPMGVGTMMWGTTWLDGKINDSILPTQTVDDIMKECAAAGVTFFDSAEGYGGGTCEVRLRDAVARTGVDPGGLCLATKFLPTLWRWTENAFIQALRHSNERMGVACCELYFIHSPVHPRELEVWVRAAAKAVGMGLMRQLGLSNFNSSQVIRAHKLAVELGVPVVANQIQYSLLVAASPELQATLTACRDRNITIIAYSTLGQGLLTDSLTPEKFKKIRLAKMQGLRYDNLSALRGELKRLAEVHGKSMAQVAVNWVVSKGAIPLVGTRSAKQLQDSLAGVQGWRLPPADVAALDAVAMGRSTLEKPRWRRALFIVFISILVLCYRLSACLFRAKVPLK